uniref:NADH-ubiquinone oxidoreductase chain 3 n=1 Tax=Urodontus glabratus TaxID=1205599 RepID=A0A0S2MSK4_9CUCU|nr:NADH deshydrogenase subunit 3 [Urodontus glabratus]
MMKILLFINLIIILIISLLILLLNLVSKKSFKDREKSSPFECGFNPKSSKRLPFSLQFFLIAVIFLIFDVEMTLLIPLVKIIEISNIMNYTIIFSFFMVVLILGTVHEWKQGALNWMT